MTTAIAMKLNDIKEMIGVDTISRKGDVITVRREFFYSGGKTAKDLAERVISAIPQARIIDKGEIRKPFRGGASTAQSSHWWVKFSLQTEVN